MIRTSIAIAAWLLATACGQSGEPAQKAEPSASAPSATTEPMTERPSTAEPKATAVADIVFVGQKQACKCTKERVAKSWQALQGSLKHWKNVKVKRIDLDVDEKEADRLDEMKTLMVAPGLYFFDAQKQLKKMLQGELTEKQISEVLASLS